jgi:acetate kinase
LRASGADRTSLIDREYDTATISDVPAAMQSVGAWLREEQRSPPSAVGHRVVHGGPEYDKPVLITEQVLVRLDQYVPLTPLHQPHNLAPIRSIRALFPKLPQVACFDTAFHRGHAAVADHFAIPQHLHAEGVRRYGFHGLSYESTMGFTPLDRLPMGTRPGQIDPGVLLYLIAEKGMTAGEVHDLLYRECGLKGLSGTSNDVRELEASVDPRAALALDYFVYRVGLSAGMLAAALGGIDVFVFTAGIGENSGLDARAHCRQARLARRGARPRRQRGRRDRDSSVGLYVIPTDEELMIARHTLAMLSASAGSGRPAKRWPAENHW